MAAGKKAAVSFDEIIKTSKLRRTFAPSCLQSDQRHFPGRERKKNENLAAQIFGRGGKGRRASAPVGEIKPGSGPSLASRVGVTKVHTCRSRKLWRCRIELIRKTQRPYVAPARPVKSNRKSTGNVDAEWTHDLHNLNNPSSNLSQLPHRGRKNRVVRDARISAALNGSASSPALNAQFNIVRDSRSQGMSIRGLAGPYAVMAQNFAPGTTAGDIESAMSPVGGEILSCRITTSTPIVMAEIIFQSKEGADNVISTFNNQKVRILLRVQSSISDHSQADGRMLYLYMKTGPVTLPFGPNSARSAPETQLTVPTGPRADSVSDRSDSRYTPSDRFQPRPRSHERRRSYDEDKVMDGSFGFEDRMETDDYDSRGRGRGLYSDDLVTGRNNQRGGRGDRGDYRRGAREGRGRR